MEEKKGKFSSPKRQIYFLPESSTITNIRPFKRRDRIQVSPLRNKSIEDVINNKRESFLSNKVQDSYTINLERKKIHFAESNVNKYQYLPEIYQANKHKKKQSFSNLPSYGKENSILPKLKAFFNLKSKENNQIFITTIKKKVQPETSLLDRTATEKNQINYIARFHSKVVSQINDFNFNSSFSILENRANEKSDSCIEMKQEKIHKFTKIQSDDSPAKELLNKIPDFLMKLIAKDLKSYKRLSSKA